VDVGEPDAENAVTVACGVVVAAAGWAVPAADSSVPTTTTPAPAAPITATTAMAARGQWRRSQGIGEAYGAAVLSGSCREFTSVLGCPQILCLWKS
jgi:hypothetical protein